MKKRSLILFLILALTITGCAGAKSAEPNAVEFEAAMEMPAEEFYDEAIEEQTSYSGDGYAAEVERIIIKNASLSIVTASPPEALDEIAAMAEQMGGFVVSSNLYKTYTSDGIEVPAANIMIRVPAEDLTKALDQIKSLVENAEEDIRDEQVSGEDVTKEYTDLQSRLRNLQDAEAQLREIMASAYDTEDVLDVFNELTEVRGEIEVIQGQINYYNEASRLSSISVNIVSKESIKPLSIGGWEPVGVARDAVQALINALQFLGDALIWIVLFIAPVLAVIFVPIFLIVRFFLRRRKQRKAKQVKEENQE